MKAYSIDHLIGPPDPVSQKRSLRFATCAPWIFLSFWTVIVLIGVRMWLMKLA